MGKFGKYNLPKFMLKKGVASIVDENSEEIDEGKGDIFVGREINLIRTLEHKYHPKSEEIKGVIQEIDETSHHKPVIIIKYAKEDGTGTYKSTLLYSSFHKPEGEFVEANSSWHYVFTAADDRSQRLLDLFVANYFESDDSEMNEDAQESQDDDQDIAQIVSIGEVTDDRVLITIITVDGEEDEIEFTYNKEDSCLDAEHNGHTYTIPLELVVDGEESKESEEDNSQDQEGKAMSNFDQFVNECWTPMAEGYNPAMSEEAKRAVKTICEELLIKEAKMCDEDHDPAHTYENYLNECGQYMTECMMEAATNIEVK